MKLQRFMSHSPFRDLPGFFTAFTGLRVELPARVESKSWYNWLNKTEDVAEVAIYDYIGSWGVSASDFLSELNSITAKNLTVRVNSGGGEVSDGLAIYNALARFDGTVSIFVDGMAASAASFICMAASKGRLFMSPHSEMLIHDGQGVCLGPAADMRKMADWLDMTSDNIAGIYARRAGGDVKMWRKAMVEETLYSDQGAVDAGLADAISSDGETVAAPPESEGEPTEDIEDQIDIAEVMRAATEQFDDFDYGAALQQQLSNV